MKTTVSVDHEGTKRLFNNAYLVPTHTPRSCRATMFASLLGLFQLSGVFLQATFRKERNWFAAQKKDEK